MEGVLSGLRVVEVAGIGPGPFCAMHLADLGADVITVQRPDGQVGTLGPTTPLNRGKRALALDLKSPAGRDQLLALVEDADILIEGMRPGVMERLGLGPSDCRGRNPRLVYGRMTGWGQSGPLALDAGHDINYIALGGALWYASPAGQPPVTPFSLAGDIAGGALYLAIGLLAAAWRARTDGAGCVVDAAIVDGSAHSLMLLLAAQARGLVTEARGESVHDASHFYATYLCGDGRYFTVGAIEPAFYRLLLEKLGLGSEPDFEAQWDRSRWPSLKARMQAVFLSRSRDEWAQVFAGTDACAAPVLSPGEASRHPHLAARGTWFDRDGFLQAVPAPRFDGAVAMPGPVPAAGEHTGAVLDALRTAGPSGPWKNAAAAHRQ